jgi:O-antigen/teichoic acid export membrane protein
LEDRKLLKQTVSTWAVVIMGLVIGQGASGLSLIIVARKVPAASLGQYLACWGLANLLIVLPNFGLENWLLTRGAPDKSLAAQFWQRSFTLRLSLVLVWLCSILALGHVLPYDTYPLAILLPTAVSVSLDSLTLLTYAAFRVVGVHYVVTLLQGISSLALLGIASSLPAQSDIFVSFAVSRAGLSAVVLLVALFIIKGWKAQCTAKHSIKTKSVLISTIPFAISDMAATTYERSGLTIVPLSLGATSTGIYGSALNILQFVFLVPRALFLIVTPILSREYIAGRGAFARIATAQITGQILSGVGLSIIIILFAPLIIKLSFGEAYWDGINVLRLLGFVPALKSANFALASIIASAGLQYQRTWVQAICAIITITANIVLVILIGLTGPVIIHTVNEMFLCAGYLWIIHRNLRKHLVT